MDNIYHERLIEVFCHNLDYYETYLGFKANNVKTNIYHHPHTEIDIKVEGKNKTALIEVKSNINGQGTFLTKQYQHYRDYNPKAEIFLLMGNKEKSLDVNDLTLQKYSLN